MPRLQSANSLLTLTRRRSGLRYPVRVSTLSKLDATRRSRARLPASHPSPQGARAAPPAAAAASSSPGERSLDFGLTDHAIRLLPIALTSPEGGARGGAALRRRLADALLQAGLLKVMADLREWGSAVLSVDVEALKAAVLEVLAPPGKSQQAQQAGQEAAAAQQQQQGAQQQQQQQQALAPAPPAPPPPVPGEGSQGPVVVG